MRDMSAHRKPHDVAGCLMLRGQKVHTRRRPRYLRRNRRRHDVTVRLVTDPCGQLLWISPALPGRSHYLTAARTLPTFPDLRTAEHPGPCRPRPHGSRPVVTTALRHPPGRDLTPPRQTANRALSAARTPVNRAMRQEFHRQRQRDGRPSGDKDRLPIQSRSRSRSRRDIRRRRHRDPQQESRPHRAPRPARVGLRGLQQPDRGQEQEPVHEQRLQPSADHIDP